jgi:membrane-bound metal-dependent hydrolase YbcI (DUF457 family)
VPVTPFHFGVGALGKALAPARLSFTAFAASQIAIDCESGYYLFVAHAWPVHRAAHTFIGATLIGLGVGIAVGLWMRRRSGRSLSAGVAGGLLGGVTHPLLDGIMHPDVQPFMPFAPGNPFLGLVGLWTLHLLCLAAGALGVALLGLRSHSP